MEPDDLRPAGDRFRRAWATLPPGQRLALALLALLVIPNPFLALRDLVPVPAQPDFAGYYLAARALSAGLSPYDADTTARLAATSGGLWYFPYLYPPVFAALLRPLAALPFDLARALWFAANLLWCGWGALLVAQVTGIPRERRWLLLVALPFLPSVHHTLELGQVNGLLLVLIALAVAAPGVAVARRRAGLRGVALGAAAAIKIFPVLVALPWLARRDWRAIGGAMLGVASLAGVGVVLGGGAASLREWFCDVLPATAAGRGFPGNQSIWAAADRLFTSQSLEAVAPGLGARMVDVPPLLQMPRLGPVVGGMLAAVLVRSAASTDPVHETASAALALTCTLMVSPIVWDHYYLLLMLPVCHLATATRGRPAARWLLLVGCGLLAVHRYWRVLLLLENPLALGLGAAGTLALWLAQVCVLQQQGQRLAST